MKVVLLASDTPKFHSYFVTLYNKAASFIKQHVILIQGKATVDT